MWGVVSHALGAGGGRGPVVVLVRSSEGQPARLIRDVHREVEDSLLAVFLWRAASLRHVYLSRQTGRTKGRNKEESYQVKPNT